MVKVCVEAVEGPLAASSSQCHSCSQMLTLSGITDIVASVNWAEINTFDLRTIVSVYYQLLFKCCTVNVCLQTHTAHTHGYVCLHSFQDSQLSTLATSVKGALKFGFSNGQARIFMFEMVSLVRQFLCPHHNLQLNVYVLSRSLNSIDDIPLIP